MVSRKIQERLESRELELDLSSRVLVSFISSAALATRVEAYALEGPFSELLNFGTRFCFENLITVTLLKTLM